MPTQSEKVFEFDQSSMEPVDTALDAALLVMQNGGSAVASERTFANILKAYHKDGIPAVLRLDFVAATGVGRGPLPTRLRPVGPIGVNLSRASGANTLAERAARGEIAAADLAAEVERVRKLPSPYNRWVMIAAAACAAAFFSQIAGGNWGSFGIAFVAAGVGQFSRSLLQANKMAGARVTLVCGVASAMIAGIGLRLGYSQAVPATLMASVVYMVPGLLLINGYIEMVSQRHLLVGLERMVHAAFIFLILAIAIALTDTLFLR